MIIHGLEIESDVELIASDGQIMAVKMLEVAKAMKVGDSVFLSDRLHAEYLKTALRSEKYKCECRRQGTSGVRVWRTE